jgi:hypothetical protein
VKIARPLAAALGLCALLGAIDCSQTPVAVTMRSLERSNKAAFVCIQSPWTDAPGVQLDRCVRYFSPGDVTIPNYTVPHMFGLVTQLTHGEVAVVDLTASTVLDLDPTTPGYNFMPVGANPTDIVTTPGGNAAFVSSAEPGREGIFALPMATILKPIFSPNGNVSGPRHLTDLPACSLPSPPGAMVIAPDWVTSRERCDGSVRSSAPPANADLSGEVAVLNNRAKLVVTLPEKSMLVVIDAQELLARPAGSFDSCPVEKMIPLDNAIPAETVLMQSVADAGPDATPAAADPVCQPPVRYPTFTPVEDAHPVAMALADDGRLFISDDRVPKVHVLDVRDPCNPKVLDPLKPASYGDPWRQVVTKAIAVSPLTCDQKRFVYATDLKDNGAVMVFDVSDGATVRTPLVRPDLAHNLYERPDRIALGSAVQAIAFARHGDEKGVTPGPGVKTGVCAPCDANNSDPSYPLRPQPGSDSTTAAAPRSLRGTFAFLLLANGQLVVVDVEDLDAPCRRPVPSATTLACGGAPVIASTDPAKNAVSNEVSCNVVERHRLRSSHFYANNSSTSGLHAPSMQNFPLLHDKDGAVSQDTAGASRRPKMLGPLFVDVSVDDPANPGTKKRTEDPVKTIVAGVTAGSDVAASLSPFPYSATAPHRAGQDGGAATEPDPALVASKNWVVFDLVEPRTHFDQTWAVTYEGEVPGFRGRIGRLQCRDPGVGRLADCEGGFEIFDSSAAFCSRGVHDATVAADLGIDSGDIVEIIERLPEPDDPYWASVGDLCSRTRCELAFGTDENPAATGSREQEVETAYQDRLTLKPKHVPDPYYYLNGKNIPIACCFPYPVAYTVRVGRQWIVTGSATGFAHHVVPDPKATDPSFARCVDSCDPRLALANGRVRMLTPDDAPLVENAEGLTSGNLRLTSDLPGLGDVSPFKDSKVTRARMFKNLQIQFALWGPEDKKCETEACVQRGMYFSFAEVGGFSSLTMPLSISSQVAPQSISYVNGIEELAIPDAAAQGLLLVDLNRLGVVQSLY